MSISGATCQPAEAGESEPATKTPTLQSPAPALAAGAKAACTVDSIEELEELEKLREPWSKLFLLSPMASPPLRWEWVWQWWRIYGSTCGQNGKGLRIITVRRQERLIGVLPLYQGRHPTLRPLRRLGFTSSGEEECEETCAEYLDLLHAPGEEAACLQALGLFLAAWPQSPWDELTLDNLSAQSPLLKLRLGGGAGWYWRRVVEAGPCHILDASGGFEAYLQRLSAKNRHEARKLLRQVDQERLRFEVAGDATGAGVFFEQMVELHRQRWAEEGKTGSFAPRHAAFHRGMVDLLAAAGSTVLGRLSNEDTPLAVVFGYRVGRKLHCYQQGVNRRCGCLRSPGTAAWLLLMRQLSGQGVEIFDQLKGLTPFKERFATGAQMMMQLQFMRPTLHRAVAVGLDWGRRLKRRVLRR